MVKTRGTNFFMVAWLCVFVNSQQRHHVSLNLPSSSSIFTWYLSNKFQYGKLFIWNNFTMNKILEIMIRSLWLLICVFEKPRETFLTVVVLIIFFCIKCGTSATWFSQKVIGFLCWVHQMLKLPWRGDNIDSLRRFKLYYLVCAFRVGIEKLSLS